MLAARLGCQSWGTAGTRAQQAARTVRAVFSPHPLPTWPGPMSPASRRSHSCRAGRRTAPGSRWSRRAACAGTAAGGGGWGALVSRPCERGRPGGRAGASKVRRASRAWAPALPARARAVSLPCQAPPSRCRHSSAAASRGAPAGPTWRKDMPSRTLSPPLPLLCTLSPASERRCMEPSERRAASCSACRTATSTCTGNVGMPVSRGA